jgi:hypothetical protein
LKIPVDLKQNQAVLSGFDGRRGRGENLLTARVSWASLAASWRSDGVISGAAVVPGGCEGHDEMRLGTASSGVWSTSTSASRCNAGGRSKAALRRVISDERLRRPGGRSERENGEKRGSGVVGFFIGGFAWRRGLGLGLDGEGVDWAAEGETVHEEESG